MRCAGEHRLPRADPGVPGALLESRFSRAACETYVNSPRLPPLVCGLQKWNEPKWNEDGLLGCGCGALPQEWARNARFPLPVFCPLDSVQEAREGHLANLTYVKLRKDGRVALLCLLEAGIATWQDFLWSLDATAHVDPSCLAWALRKMEEAWPEQRLAKLSVEQPARWPRLPVSPNLCGPDALGSHLRDAALQQRLAPARLRFRDGGGVLCRGPDPPGAGGGAGALPQVPEDRLPGPPGRHAGLQVRAGRAAAGPPLRARDPGLAAAAPRLGASRGRGGPLPAGAQPAAHRAARHQEDAPCEAHRGAAAGGRRRGAAGLESRTWGWERRPPTTGCAARCATAAASSIGW